ncbi:hypothetical protein JCM10908_004156 [Rhodotorula pacifica]|uniref:flavin-linked sulfhydryl oxidase n=1 Tax=Rhodotorula pacifica TaxID=1495444 RepID=UPI0031802A42
MARFLAGILSLHRSTSWSLPIVTFLSAAILLVLAFTALGSSFDSSKEHNRLWASGSVGHEASERGPSGSRAAALAVDNGDGKEWTTGHVIMPKLGNATAKAELGRASWRLLHTMAARFPEEPTENERETFKSFLHIFSRLYPCGECAAEFQHLLAQHPPQTSSRGTASMYLCHLHNLVNARLGKDEFDCGENLKEIYDCGCGDDDDEEGGGLGKGRGGEKAKKEVRESGKDGEVAVPPRSGRTRVSFTEEGERDPVTGLELVGG